MLMAQALVSTEGLDMTKPLGMPLENQLIYLVPKLTEIDGRALRLTFDIRTVRLS